MFTKKYIWAFALILPSAFAWSQDTSECRQYGNDAGVLRAQVERLCQGATGSGPVQCFLKALQSDGLAGNDSVQLCRCAQSTVPADCVQAAQRKLHVNMQEALLTCEDPSRKSPAERQCLGLNQP